MPPLTSPAAESLHAAARRLRDAGIRHLFAADPERHLDMTATAAGLELDYSRQLIDAEAMDTLIALAESAGLAAAMAALQSGEAINNTEQRAALHTALRAATGTRDDVDAAREAMREHCAALRGATRRGFDGAPITDIVNIGIGGSDLGPRLVADALGTVPGAPRCHFVSNVDPDDLQRCLAACAPGSTLFIVCSKSFRTEETRVNAEAARDWLRGAGCDDQALDRHFLAVSSNLEAAAQFGIPADNCLPMWDWVGGRFSVWSTVGLSAAVAIGWENFEAMLAGAAAMDEHALAAAPRDNLPMLSALLDIWNSNFLGMGTLAVLPYSQRLALLPAYLQQLVMESNGKGVSSSGSALAWDSAPILWGAAGTIGQHSFHQLLHQGTRACAMELVLPLSNPAQPEQHARLVAHCLAQSSVFLSGRSEESARRALLERGMSAPRATELAPHLAMPGERPHSLLSFERLSPRALGALLAYWEHRTFFAARLLDINAFDQWGVELGKEVSGTIRAAMQEGTDSTAQKQLDAGTRRLLERWRTLR
jgi:glucose-6-phosphate isomerase